MTNQNKDNFTKSNSVHSDVKGDLFTSKLMRGTPISEEIFDNPTTTDVPVTKPAHSHLLRNILYGVTAAVIAFLAFATFWFYRAAHPTSKTATDYGATTADIAALTATKASTANGFVIINGNANVNGSVTADTFTGNGADLSNVNATRLNSQPGSFYQNADNIDAGTLNDARLSGNVALLDAGQSFTGTNSFANTTSFVNLLVSGTTTATGAVTINNNLTVTGDTVVGGTLGVNGLSYSWPGVQANGILSNDGAGNLSWQPVGACASCLTNGGNAFGTTISVGTNDANALYLRTNGANQVTLDTTGNLGIGVTPGYKLDVNGDVNVSAGNAFRIGGTAICTSGGCAASAGSTDYVQNSASLQTGVNFNFEIASINSVGGIIRAKAGQVSDLQQWQSSGGVALAYVDAAGDFSANSALKINGTTVCTISGCTAAGGSGVYIQNSTSLQTTANFNIQSAAAGSVGGVIRGAVGQTADLQQWQDGSGNNLLSVDATGALVFSALNTGYNTLSLGSGAPYNWNGALALQDPTNSWGPGATIFSPGEIDIMGNKNWPNGDHNGASLYTLNGISGSAILDLYGMSESRIGLHSNDYTNSASIVLDQSGVLNIYSPVLGLNGTTTVYSQSTTDTTFGVKAIGSQTGDLTRWLSSTGTPLASVDVAGRFVATTLGSADTSTYLCRNSSNQIASCSGSASGSAFVQGG